MLIYYAPAGTDLLGMPFSPLTPGDETNVAGFTLRTVGGWHAPVMPDQAPYPNLGYVVETETGSVYHPGDALDSPTEPVDLLLVPIQASWLKTVEAVTFTRAIAPERATGIHDAQVNRRATSSIGRWLADFGCRAYRWVEPGTRL